jgi:hypothetical protein
LGWLSGWSYRKSHKITGSTAGAVSNYQIPITVHYGSGSDSGGDVYLNGKCRSDFGDIRFTDSDGVTLLPYWVEDKVDGNYAKVWVKVPSIPASPSQATIYIYYGNSSATSASSGADTWLLFDDFENPNTLSNYSADIGSITNWEIVSFGGSNALHYKGSDGYWYLLSRVGVTFQNLRVKAKIYVNASANYYIGLAFREIDSSNFYFVWLARDAGGYAGSPSGSRIDWLKRVAGLDRYISGGSTNNLNYLWSSVEVVIYGSSLKAFLNGVQKISASDTAISSAGKVGFIGLYNAYFDDFCVGAYVDPEPVNDVWGSEEVVVYPQLNVDDKGLDYDDGLISLSAFTSLNVDDKGLNYDDKPITLSAYTYLNVDELGLDYGDAAISLTPPTLNVYEFGLSYVDKTIAVKPVAAAFNLSWLILLMVVAALVAATAISVKKYRQLFNPYIGS